MEKFLSRFRPFVTGILSGFDRLVFRGVLQPLMRSHGLYYFLEDSKIQLLDFKRFALETTERLKEASLAEARRLERPIRFLQSGSIDKEQTARRILAEQPIERGLICILTVNEPCMTFEYHRSRNPTERGFRLQPGKCLHLYHYLLHPRFGFMSARIQTWFPFNIQICLNGREWLSTQLRANRRGQFRRADNCFTWLEKPTHAQRLMDEQLALDWPRALNSIAHSLNPRHSSIFRHSPMSYYWSAYQTEWATDVMFHNPAALAEIYPNLIRHATLHFQSPDVMRFLARKAPGNFNGPIVTSFKDRVEGVRVKHWLGGNSIKMYDKAGSVLRIETTIGDPTDFKVFRPRKDGTQLEWLPLRKGVADLHRRAQVSQRSNDTYLDRLSVVDDQTPCSKIFDTVSRPRIYRRQRVRALRLGDPADIALLSAISRGEFATSGFRNRDLRKHLFAKTSESDPIQRRRNSARVSRLLRVLRAHGLIHKISKTSRYSLTQSGQLLTAALFATRNANIKDLLRTAA